MKLSEMRESSRKKVLVVDDDAAFGESARDFLAFCLPGYDVEFCLSNPHDSSYEAPWEYICHQHPLLAAVISDTHMPGMNGIQLCAAVRRHYPDIPFVLMSSDFGPFANDLRNLPPASQPTAMVSKHDIMTRAKVELLAMNVFSPAGAVA